MISIDVIIPTYNAGDLLADALDSVAAQLRPPRRVLVVDDGSTDDAVYRCTVGRSNVTVIRQPNAGVSAARNTGAAASQADALLFLDQDDMLTPSGLATLAAALESSPGLEMVHGMMREFVDPNSPPPPGVRTTDRVIASRLSGSTLLTRGLWLRIGELRIGMTQGEWIDWVDRAMSSGAAVATVDAVVCQRRIHAHNTTRVASGKAQYVGVARAALRRKRRVNNTEI